MSEQSIQPRQARRSRFLLFAILLATLFFIITAIFGMQVFAVHFNSAASSGSSHHDTGQNPPVAKPTGEQLAVITNSGSTNLPGLTLTINKDGSGSLHFDKGRNQLKRDKDQTFPSGTFDTTKLSSILNQLQDMSKVPNHSCLKSVSFGTTTTITYNGKTSGDISCLSSQDGQVFSQLRLLIQNFYNKYMQSLL